MGQRIIHQLGNNVPHGQMGRILDIPPSTVHNIIKRLYYIWNPVKSGCIKGKAEKYLWMRMISDHSDVTVLKIVLRHDIVTWAREYFGIGVLNTCIKYNKLSNPASSKRRSWTQWPCHQQMDAMNSVTKGRYFRGHCTNWMRLWTERSSRQGWPKLRPPIKSPCR